MSKYTIKDVGHIIPVEQTANTIVAIEKYLNEGVIPPVDPCLSCEPNHIRKLISLIQVGERNGLFPPAREEEKPKPKPRAKAKAEIEPQEEDRIIAIGGNDDPNVDFSEVFKD